MKRNAALTLVFLLFISYICGQEFGDTGAQIPDLLDDEQDEQQVEGEIIINTQSPITYTPQPLPQPQPSRPSTTIYKVRQKLKRTSPKTQTTTVESVPIEKSKIEDDQCSGRFDIVSIFSCTNCTSDDDCRKGQFVCCTVPYIFSPLLVQSNNIQDRKCCVIKKPATTTTENPSTSPLPSTTSKA